MNLTTPSAKQWIGILLVLLVAIQFVPVDRANPPVEAEVPVSQPVRAVLRRSCYDCHSNETAWPAYSRVAPISWLVAHDVHEAREKLNFSTWNRGKPEERIKAMDKLWKEVEEGEMPLWSYVLLHQEARLSADDREILRAWTKSTEGSK